MKKLLASLALGVASLVYGQSYPSKPIKIIIPFPPGNTTDIMTRLIGPKMTERLGQQIVVENRPGASGMLGLDWSRNPPPTATRSPPDRAATWSCCRTPAGTSRTTR